MSLSEFAEIHLKAVVVAGRTLGKRGSGHPILEEEHVSTPSGLPFSVLPNDEDRQGKVGLEIARLLHESGIDTHLLLSWELLQREGPVLPSGSYQPFFTEEGLEELFVSLLKREKPDILFIGSTTVSYRILPQAAGSGRFSIEIETEPSLFQAVTSNAGEECTVVRCPVIGRVDENEVSAIAAQHIARGCNEFRSSQEGRLFARSGVMSSFERAEPYRSVRKH